MASRQPCWFAEKIQRGLNSFLNNFSLFFQEICIADGHVSEKDLYKYATAGQINLKKKTTIAEKGTV